MADGFDTWESYFYPETYNPQLGNGMLRNKGDTSAAVRLTVIAARGGIGRLRRRGLA